MSTHLLPHGERTFAIEFDFFHHQLYVRVSDGSVGTHELKSQSVAEFYRAVMAVLEGMSLGVRVWSMPVEIPDPIRFEDDTVHHIYDGAAALRWWQIVARIAPIFADERSRFVGKTSPVHFFWGAFDLAVTRFSGRPAPPREGPRFMREAYSHEVISHGFWPGSGPVLEPAFYAYAVPEPEGLKEAAVQPSAAYYHRELGEFILPYEAVRDRARSRGSDPGVRRQHLRSRRHARPMGSRRARAAGRRAVKPLTTKDTKDTKEIHWSSFVSFAFFVVEGRICLRSHPIEKRNNRKHAEHAEPK